MGTGRQYNEEFKKQAILLAKEIGNAAAATELGIPIAIQQKSSGLDISGKM